MQNLFCKKQSEGINDSVISSSWTYCYLQPLENKIRAESASYFFLALFKSALLSHCLKPPHK